MGNIVGVDVGGTTIKSALLSPKGSILRRHEVRTEAKKGAKEMIKRIFSSIEEVKEEGILGIGIGSPGPMNYRKGIITNPVNLPFKNTPLKKIVGGKRSEERRGGEG